MAGRQDEHKRDNMVERLLPLLHRDLRPRVGVRNRLLDPNWKTLGQFRANIKGLGPRPTHEKITTHFHELQNTEPGLLGDLVLPGRETMARAWSGDKDPGPCSLSHNSKWLWLLSALLVVLDEDVQLGSKAGSRALERALPSPARHTPRSSGGPTLVQGETQINEAEDTRLARAVTLVEMNILHVGRRADGSQLMRIVPGDSLLSPGVELRLAVLDPFGWVMHAIREGAWPECCLMGPTEDLALFSIAAFEAHPDAIRIHDLWLPGRTIWVDDNEGLISPYGQDRECEDGTIERAPARPFDATCLHGECHVHALRNAWASGRTIQKWMNRLTSADRDGFERARRRWRTRKFQLNA